MVLGSVQPSYLAWIPLFERIQSSDVFVHLDDVEYSKNSFHNRNAIKTVNGSLLLTVPVLYFGHSKTFINEIQIDYQKPWQKKHWKSIELAYGKAPYFKDLAIPLKEILFTRWDALSNLNIVVIQLLAKYLGITTPMYTSSQFKIPEGGNDKLIQLCRYLTADHFLVKPNTEDYHPSEYFKKSDIGFRYFQSLQRVYPQLHGEFIPNLSGLDYAMNCGPNSF